jgi:hypothetical protein
MLKVAIFPGLLITSIGRRAGDYLWQIYTLWTGYYWVYTASIYGYSMFAESLKTRCLFCQKKFFLSIFSVIRQISSLFVVLVEKLFGGEFFLTYCTQCSGSVTFVISGSLLFLRILYF